MRVDSQTSPPRNFTANSIFGLLDTATTPISNTSRRFSPLDDENLPFVSLKGVALGGLVIWTVIANALVFVVLYKNPRLQTVPNFLVGNLAFSDLCLGLVVLPLASVYAVTLSWPFGKTLCEIWLSSDVLCSTASIWNLSIIGLDRYWAITLPIKYMAKRTMRFAILMIVSCWALAMLISVAPFFGWRNASEKGNYYFSNETLDFQCGFLDLPSYSIYSATGSFLIPSMVMFFVYFQIYRAFAEHKARHMYRQQVLKKHIESTILHEISHVLPIPLPRGDEYGKDEDDDDDYDSEEDSYDEERDDARRDDDRDRVDRVDCGKSSVITVSTVVERTCSVPNNRASSIPNGERVPLRHASTRRSLARKTPHLRETGRSRTTSLLVDGCGKHRVSFTPVSTPNSLRRPLIGDGAKNQYKKRDGGGANGKKQPAAISAAKEKRGVKVLGIILGCFTVCWAPFFFMYSITGLCQSCRPNQHVEQFITWLGYSNSAMNPIIYTVFNRDYQTALKRLFGRKSTSCGIARKRKAQDV